MQHMQCLLPWGQGANQGLEDDAALVHFLSKGHSGDAQSNAYSQSIDVLLQQVKFTTIGFKE